MIYIYDERKIKLQHTLFYEYWFTKRKFDKRFINLNQLQIYKNDKTI